MSEDKKQRLPALYSPYTNYYPDYSRLKDGPKIFKGDNLLRLNAFANSSRKIDKTKIYTAIENRDFKALREYSRFFYETSGIYARMIRYFANLYRYDYFVTPLIRKPGGKEEKIIKTFENALSFLYNTQVKKLCSSIALSVLIDGAYYGYIIQNPASATLQELPIDYCRVRFYNEGLPVVEFNMKYFDDTFRDVEYRQRVIQIFPKEFAKGYNLYKQGKLPAQYSGDTTGWYPLDPRQTVFFTLGGSLLPVLISTLPALVDLEDAKNIDKERMKRRLVKILIQEIQLDKNGELVFDIDEIKQLHRNAVDMIGNSQGIDVLTSPAKIEVADLSDKSNVSTVDELEKVERAVFNEGGVSEEMFNSTGNVALNLSILNDEAFLANLVEQFTEMLQRFIKRFNNKINIVEYRVEILQTTIYNYKELASQYQTLSQYGYSKLLSPVALGQSQDAVLATAKFENDILKLNEIFIPPQSSATVSPSEIAGAGGRPELSPEEKDDKTIANEEAASGGET